MGAIGVQDGDLALTVAKGDQALAKVFEGFDLVGLKLVGVGYHEPPAGVFVEIAGCHGSPHLLSRGLRMGRQVVGCWGRLKGFALEDLHGKPSFGVEGELGKKGDLVPLREHKVHSSYEGTED